MKAQHQHAESPTSKLFISTFSTKLYVTDIRASSLSRLIMFCSSLKRTKPPTVLTSADRGLGTRRITKKSSYLISSEEKGTGAQHEAPSSSNTKNAAQPKTHRIERMLWFILTCCIVSRDSHRGKIKKLAVSSPQLFSLGGRPRLEQLHARSNVQITCSAVMKL